MGIDDILKKVDEERTRLTKIDSALSHGSLSSSEKAELKREKDASRVHT